MKVNCITITGTSTVRKKYEGGAIDFIKMAMRDCAHEIANELVKQLLKQNCEEISFAKETPNFLLDPLTHERYAMKINLISNKDLTELERLAKIGEATEKAFETLDAEFYIGRDHDDSDELFWDTAELLEWAEVNNDR